MNRGMGKTAAGMLALALVSAVWAGGGTSTGTGSLSGTQASSGSEAAVAGGGGVAHAGRGVQDSALQRKQARAARHAAIDKARQQAVDSLRTAFGRRAAAAAAGSSEGMNEKLRSESKAKRSTP